MGLRLALGTGGDAGPEASASDVEFCQQNRSAFRLSQRRSTKLASKESMIGQGAGGLEIGLRLAFGTIASGGDAAPEASASDVEFCQQNRSAFKLSQRRSTKLASTEKFSQYDRPGSRRSGDRPPLGLGHYCQWRGCGTRSLCLRC